MQEKLLLLLDEELDKEAAEKVTTTIQIDKAVAKEWQLLQQTKLSIKDVVVFTDKAFLYKKEKGKLIPIGFWRIAAAAVLIGFGLWGTIGYLKNGDSGGGKSVAVNSTKKPEVKEISTSPETKVAADKTLQQDTASATNNIASRNSTIEKVADKIQAAVKDKNNEVVVVDDLPVKGVEEEAQKTNNLPTPLLQKINGSLGNNIEAASVQQSKDEIKPLDNQNLTDAAQPYAVNTSFTEDKEKITYGFDEEEDQPKKTKVGGFFKKINRVLQRKANIKTGNSSSFKVANLSFAVQ